MCGKDTPMTAIEAMYFGCAVVSTWVGGLPNLIQAGFNGLLVPPSAPALEAALESLLIDDELRVQLGRNAMQHAVALYGLDRWRQQVAPVITRQLRLGAHAT